MARSDESTSDRQELPGDDEEAADTLGQPSSDEEAESGTEHPPAGGVSTGADDATPEPAAPSWLDAETSDEAPQDDVVPSWLTSELEAEGVTSPTETGDADAPFDPEATMVASGRLTPTAESVPGWLQAELTQDAEEEPDLPDDHELGWLDQIAAGEGAAIDELPTMSWAEEEAQMPESSRMLAADSGLADEDEGEEAEEILAGEEAETDEGLEPVGAETIARESELDDTVVGELPAVPEDPDEAMAWLEQLAARQGASSDELTTAISQTAPLSDFDPETFQSQSTSPPDEEIAEPTADEGQPDAEREPSTSEATEVPEDPDEAMAWLERIASDRESAAEATQGPPEEAQEEWPVDEMDEELASVMAELADVELPHDAAQAMAWLGELGEITPSADQGEDIVVEEMQTPATEQDVVTARVEAEQLLAKEELITPVDAVVPTQEEDTDGEDALAWLEQLADGQDATQEQPPSAEATETSVPEVVDGREDHELALGLQGEEVSELSDVDAVEPSGADDFFEATAEAEAQSWLATDLSGVAGDQELDWLDSLNELDAESWLQSEAMAAVPDVSPMETEAEPDVVAAMEREEFAEETADIQEEPVAELEPDVVEVAQADEELLSRARSALGTGDLEVAAEAYSELLEAGEGLPFLIADLESKSEELSGQTLLQRVLGDAYVRNGQLQKAVETYRQALDSL